MVIIDSRNFLLAFLLFLDPLFLAASLTVFLCHLKTFGVVCFDFFFFLIIIFDLFITDFSIVVIMKLKIFYSYNMLFWVNNFDSVSVQFSSVAQLFSLPSYI